VIASLKKVVLTRMNMDLQLVEQVRGMQVTDSIFRDQWGAHCDMNGGGRRDPSQHDATFLTTFLAGWTAGMRFDLSALALPQVQTLQAPASGQSYPSQLMTSDDGMMPILFKEGQSKSSNWKCAWWAYCQTYGGGVNDPMKHETNFLSGFLDFVGQQGALALSVSGTAPVPKGSAADPAAKRAKLAVDSSALVSLGVASGFGQPAPAPDAEKADLITRVKDYQRQGEAQKTEWGVFCDTHLGGIRDPARHDANVLQQFLLQSPQLQLPSTQVVTEPPPPPAPLVVLPMITNSRDGSSGDPVKDEFVSKIKAFQRTSEENKSAWGAFCDANLGGIRDPNRHEASVLAQFVINIS